MLARQHVSVSDVRRRTKNPTAAGQQRPAISDVASQLGQEELGSPASVLSGVRGGIKTQTWFVLGWNMQHGQVVLCPLAFDLAATTNRYPSFKLLT